MIEYACPCCGSLDRWVGVCLDCRGSCKFDDFGHPAQKGKWCPANPDRGLIEMIDSINKETA